MLEIKINKLSKLYLKACGHLGISHQDSKNILGSDPQSIDQRACTWFYANNKARKTAINLIQIYIQLFVISGGDMHFLAHWFSTRNFALDGIPKELVKQETVDYLFWII